ncbi:Rpp20 subunit of nuclear RNase MRP and P-domain-containing protein [Aspergillus coremiiformis]|uniref:Rpp20 subunit of nuclear RNase MRP and P-domain-containing protein n=1 Tax=Aspergillus coremiiformis TaxID=138285 RepID=A0A5N6Z8Q4_9EURO|nr:Rpp20 subunit of nuclear RNase MRP and P-domain-containing protein [Aspergillus coremiiformis]
MRNKNPHPLTSTLTFEKKNQETLKLPQYARIQKRPIPHAPTASPYAGASVPKIVYMSSKTPFMSAVKRVQKFLRVAEKRATASVELLNRKKGEGQKLAQIARGQEALRKEVVVVKATGRAMERALGVGRWFREREGEYSVRVETGAVLVVDDVVEDEAERVRKDAGADAEEGCVSKSAAKRRRRAANALAEMEELPETRTRWVNKVEISIAFK